MSREPASGTDAQDELVAACADRAARALGGDVEVCPHVATGLPELLVQSPDGRSGRVRTDPWEVAPPRRDEVVVEAAGLVGGLGDLLLARAVEHLGDEPVAAHVSVASPGPGGTPGLFTDAEFGAAARTLHRPVEVLDDGRWQEGLLGEVRRLAWFPRPLGAQHATADGEVLPRVWSRRHPELRDASTHLAMRAWRAELAQLLAGRNARRGDGDGSGPPAQLPALLTRRRNGIDRAGRAWAVVAEAHRADGHVERCWAEGTDPVGTSAELATLVARVLATTVVALPARAVTPADVLDAGPTLDLLGAATGLRWGRVVGRRN